MEDKYDKEFKININNIRHQYSNTECGLFSIAFQTRWISLLRTNKEDVNFLKVIKFEGYKDKYMKKLRNMIFRPNINILKNINSN